MDPAQTVAAVAFVPDRPLSTEVARGLLPKLVPHADAARTAGRAALLAAALLQGRTDLLLAATEDRLHQDYRAPAMPDSAELIAALRAAGHAAVVSGAGPTVLVLTTKDQVPTVVGAGSAAAGPGWTGFDLALDLAGAVSLNTADGAWAGNGSALQDSNPRHGGL
jgi:homoserine kinase